MARHPETHTPIASMLRKLINSQGPRTGGFSHERIAVAMQDRGHTDWNSSTVYRFASGTRPITLDEGASLLGFIKGNAAALFAEVDKIAAEIESTAKKGKS
jgi:hypothetical protein